MLAALRQARAARLLGLQARAASGGLQRDLRFAACSDADLAFFESVVGPAGVVTDPHDLQPFNRRALAEAGLPHDAGRRAATTMGASIHRQQQ